MKNATDPDRLVSSENTDRLIRGAKTLKTLVLGETIIDEYVYCQALGKSGKEPVLALKQLSDECFAGGALAVANTAASFCDRVDVLTVLGGRDSREDFIRSNLNEKIKPFFVYQDGAPTITKLRYLENDPPQKLLEIYRLERQNDPRVTAGVISILNEHIPDYDALIVVDYGHGLLTNPIVDCLCRSEAFLSINTQSNAENFGFHTISRYPRADFISLSEKEIRLDARDREREIETIMQEVAGSLSCRNLLVTAGREGNRIYSPGLGFFQSLPAADRIVDRVGAGDLIFAVVSLMAVQNAPPEIMAEIASAVGDLAVEMMGHRQSITPGQLMVQLEKRANNQSF